jgi:hypothetical protein
MPIAPAAAGIVVARALLQRSGDVHAHERRRDGR